MEDEMKYTTEDVSNLSHIMKPDEYKYSKRVIHFRVLNKEETETVFKDKKAEDIVVISKIVDVDSFQPSIQFFIRDKNPWGFLAYQSSHWDSMNGIAISEMRKLFDDNSVTVSKTMT